MAELNYKIEVCYRKENGKESTALPFQKKFHEACLDYKYVLCAGEIGSGITEMIVLEALRQSWAYKNNYGLLIAKDISAIDSALKRLCLTDTVLSWNYWDKKITLLNNSVIQIASFKVPLKIMKRKRLGWFGIDNQHSADEDLYWALTRRLRKWNSSRIGFGGMYRAGHDWNWKIWKRGDVPKPERFKLIETHVEDNIYLPKEYLSKM